LIGNALSHNDKNSALIVVDCKEEVDYYVFSVTDNGPGIAKEREEDFNTFQSLVNNDKSTGLGLSIVKNCRKL
jgi:K+-sensing histidine kinase KdpD